VSFQHFRHLILKGAEKEIYIKIIGI
jgi:hypothetical protein